MAFGVSPKFSTDISAGELSDRHFLVIAVETAKKIGWEIGEINETRFVAYTKFSLSSHGEQVAISVENNIVNLKSECIGNQLSDHGKNKRNIELFLSTFDELKTLFGEEELEHKYEELKASIISTEGEHALKTPENLKQASGSFLSIFIPRPGFTATPIIIDLNILVFVLMVTSGISVLMPDGPSMIRWGANFGPQTLNGEWWRLFTCIFLHFGIMHLLFNMYALLYIGVLLEQYLGTSLFVSAYIVTGIAASLTSLGWHGYAISAGASGAIFGLYGLFFAMLTTNLIEKSARKTLLTSIAVFIGYNLLNGMKSGIDNAAHIGGLLSGLIIGYAFTPILKDAGNLALRKRTIILLFAVALGGSVFAYSNMTNVLSLYEKKMETFSSRETAALEIYKLPESTSKEEFLSAVKRNGIDNWEENIKLVRELDKLDLPGPIHVRNKELIYYCQLRIKTCELIYRGIEEGDVTRYKQDIEDCSLTINKLMKDLKEN